MKYWDNFKTNLKQKNKQQTMNCKEMRMQDVKIGENKIYKKDAKKIK